MRVAKTDTGKFLRNASGKILKLLPDAYIEPKPDVLMIQIEVDAGQVFTLPTPNNFSYVNTSNNSVSSGNLVYNYTVDWGDGTPGATITTYNSASRIHTYTEAGTYVIEISGTFPCWDTNNDSQIRLLITRVISWGNTGLKKINFYGCSSLTNLPEQQGKLSGLLTATYFCAGCSGLTSIPYGTFFGCTLVADFISCFQNCAKLKTIHSTTFRDCTGAILFNYVFTGCQKLEYIPEPLFANCPNVRQFFGAFQSCTTITSVPAGLFQYNTYSGCSFAYLFYGCSALTSLPYGLFANAKSSSFYSMCQYCYALTTIPQDLFKGQNLVADFYYTFANCSKLTGIPSGVFDLNVSGTNNCTGSLYQTFWQCGTDASVTEFTIATGLFDQLTKATSLQYCFAYTKLVTIPNGFLDNCVSITNMYGTFIGTRIAAIPTDLLRYCTELNNVSNLFSSCGQLVTSGIPSGLFSYNTKITTFSSTFFNCTNVGFTTVPANTFANCTAATDFEGLFNNCTYFNEIPTDLFRYNILMNKANSAFAGTRITTLSDNVFKYNLALTTVVSCFNNCKYLTSISEDLFNTNNSNPNAIVDFNSCFTSCDNAGFTSIPAGLFRYSINAKNFSYCFRQCTKITAIPSGLFQYNLLAENFEYCFERWIMTSIPSNLFSGLTQVNNVRSCFYYCHELLSIPSGLFDSIGGSLSVNYTSCFAIQGTGASYNKITGAVPELWTKPNNPVGTQCFLNRTAVSNYASIPAGWK